MNITDLEVNKREELLKVHSQQEKRQQEKTAAFLFQMKKRDEREVSRMNIFLNQMNFQSIREHLSLKIFQENLTQEKLKKVQLIIL